MPIVGYTNWLMVTDINFLHHFRIVMEVRIMRI
mgnify:CR=1 FL=1